MNKEEILAKSRNENSTSDERAQYIALKGANFSITVLIILWIVLSQLIPQNDAGQYAMGLLVTVTSFSNLAYQLSQNKTKTNFFFAALFLIAAFVYLFFFLTRGINVI